MSHCVDWAGQGRQSRAGQAEQGRQSRAGRAGQAEQGRQSRAGQGRAVSEWLTIFGLAVKAEGGGSDAQALGQPGAEALVGMLGLPGLHEAGLAEVCSVPELQPGCPLLACTQHGVSDMASLWGILLCRSNLQCLDCCRWAGVQGLQQLQPACPARIKQDWLRDGQGFEAACTCSVPAASFTSHYCAPSCKSLSTTRVKMMPSLHIAFACSHVPPVALTLAAAIWCLNVFNGSVYVPTIEKFDVGTLALHRSEEAANALCAHPLCYTSCPILFLDGLLRQVGATQHPKDHLHPKENCSGMRVTTWLTCLYNS